ncbi:MAG TPA: F0F1 ATP synthase subunit delta [Sulfuricurvum sp.]|nr:F0F1 ATP synthase subunit delta [Sulfuricurvum sp.]
MKQELIAKRYVQSLMAVLDDSSLDNAAELFEVLATAFNDSKFQQIMHSNDIAASVKTNLVLEMAATANSNEINNLIKLLGENGRLAFIPAIAKELKRQIASNKRVYNGRIYSDSAIDQNSVNTIARDLGTKMNATISLQFVPSNYDGVRVVVDDLNVEIDFSKSRLNAQIVEHILKAI